MPDGSLIVPTVLASGSQHFAEVRSNGTVQDVIDVLTALEEVKSDILGELQEDGWALQKIRVQQRGRQWEENELEAFGDGMFMT
jgi:diaphanous 1